MEKQKENLFLEKFCLLNSQKHSEEINWSSSCSSDYEDTSLNDKSCNRIIKRRTLKRKRKKKVPKNISNLSITTLDTSRDKTKDIPKEKSPILGCKSRHKSASLSPILKPSKSFILGNNITSPILASKTTRLKSPILAPKVESPKSAPKVRKKLFDSRNLRTNVYKNEEQLRNMKQEDSISIKKEEVTIEDISTSQSMESGEIDYLNANRSKTKLDIVKKVKSFFDSHFSSENTSTSQNSISDILTPKNSTKTSDEIEIFTLKTQIPPNNSSQCLKQETLTNSSESSVYNFDKNTKKIRYKKGGMANRLHNLLKKRNASISLWQHERFLAANSNFVIPKGEFTMFRIQNVNIKYGCHLLEAVNVDNVFYLILINSCHVSDNIVSETIIKLYEPFNIVQYDNNCKLIINVTKFECSDYKS